MQALVRLQRELRWLLEDAVEDYQLLAFHSPNTRPAKLRIPWLQLQDLWQRRLNNRRETDMQKRTLQCGLNLLQCLNCDRGLQGATAVSDNRGTLAGSRPSCGPWIPDPAP